MGMYNMIPFLYQKIKCLEVTLEEYATKYWQWWSLVGNIMGLWALIIFSVFDFPITSIFFVIKNVMEKVFLCNSKILLKL